MNYYDLLGIPYNATQEDIKKAYRIKAKEYHPDLNPNDKNAETMFKKIHEAYESLTNSVKKTVYDRKNKNNAKTKKTTQQTQSAKKEDWGPVLECTFFGNNIMAQLPLTKLELKNGCSKYVLIQYRQKCTKCHGYKYGGNKICHACDGTGNTLKDKLFNLGPECPVCKGLGNVDYNCQLCNGTGKGLIDKKRTYVAVPPNSYNGKIIIMKSMGEESTDAPSGHLHIVLIEK